MSQLIKQLALLYELQKFDQHIQILKQKKEQAPKRIRALDALLEKHEKRLASKRSELAEISKRQRSLNGKLKLQRTDLEKYEEQIRSVKDNKQYKALETEMDLLEVKNSELEDEILELMDEADEIEAELNSYEEELNKVKADYKADKVEFEKVIKEIDKKITDLKRKQKPFYSKISKDLLRRYNAWQGRGLFLLSVVKGNVCGGCNLIVPQQTINEINKNEKFIVCGSCGRILYIP